MNTGNEPARIENTSCGLSWSSCLNSHTESQRQHTKTNTQTHQVHNQQLTLNTIYTPSACGHFMSGIGQQICKKKGHSCEQPFYPFMCLLFAIDLRLIPVADSRRAIPIGIKGTSTLSPFYKMRISIIYINSLNRITEVTGEIYSPRPVRFT